MRRSRWNASISSKTLRRPSGGSASSTRCGKSRSFLRPMISRLRRVISPNPLRLRASLLGAALCGAPSLRPARSSEDEAAAIVPGLPRGARCALRRVGFIAANLIAFCRSKTVSKAVHAPPADGPCRKAGTVCVGVNLISADGTPGVSVAVSVRAYTLVADRACRSAVAVTVSADVLATDPACRVAVSISVRVHSAIAVYTCRITRSIRVKGGALGVQRRNGYRQHQHCKDGACHRTPLLLLVCRPECLPGTSNNSWFWRFCLS